jgi:hypothetical protein
MNRSWMWKQRSYREQFQGDELNGSAGGAAEARQQDEQAQADEQKPEGETPEDNPSADGGASAQAAPEDGEVVITIGDETPLTNDDEIEGRPAPAWVRDLRKSDREKAKRIRELEQQIAAGQQAQQPQTIQVGEKPTLEGCEYDAEKYGEELLAWNERKRKADEQAAAARAEQEAAAEAWNKKVTAYKSAAAALKVGDFDHAELVVTSLLDRTQQGILLHGPNSADVVAKLTYALGSNEVEAKKLAAIKDPIKFAFAAADLIGKIKVQQRNNPPAPERQVRGSTGGATAIDNTLERLEAEADRTGDRSKVIQYKAEQRRKAAQAA